MGPTVGQKPMMTRANLTMIKATMSAQTIPQITQGFDLHQFLKLEDAIYPVLQLRDSSKEGSPVRLERNLAKNNKEKKKKEKSMVCRMQPCRGQLDRLNITPIQLQQKTYKLLAEHDSGKFLLLPHKTCIRTCISFWIISVKRLKQQFFIF